MKDGATGFRFFGTFFSGTGNVVNNHGLSFQVAGAFVAMYLKTQEEHVQWGQGIIAITGTPRWANRGAP